MTEKEWVFVRGKHLRKKRREQDQQGETGSRRTRQGREPFRTSFCRSHPEKGNDMGEEEKTDRCGKGPHETLLGTATGFALSSGGCNFPLDLLDDPVQRGLAAEVHIDASSGGKGLQRLGVEPAADDLSLIVHDELPRDRFSAVVELRND